MTEIRSAGGPKHLNAYLRRDFMRLVAEDVRLSALWHTLMPEPLVAHARPVSYANGHLVLHADSSAWASRVRQQQQALCQCLRRDPFFKNLTGLSARIAPPGADEVLRPIPKKHAVQCFSARAIDALQSSARATSDPALQAALERLARTASAALKEPDETR